MKNLFTQLLIVFILISLPLYSFSQSPCEDYDQSMSEVDGLLNKYPVDYNKLLKQLEEIKENCPEKAAEVDAKIEEVTAKKKAKIEKDRRAYAKAVERKKAAEMARRKAQEQQPRQKDRSAGKGLFEQPAPRMSSTGIYDNFPGYVAFYTQDLDERKFEAPKAMRSFPEESGVIQIDICIDKNGTVVSAKVNTEISNISTKEWHEKLIAHAKNFQFNATADPNQCGSIRYLFKKI